MGKKKTKTDKRIGQRGGKHAALLSAPVASSHEFEGLVGFEEISSCTLMKLSKYGRVKREIWEGGRIKKVSSINSFSFIAKIFLQSSFSSFIEIHWKT